MEPDLVAKAKKKFLSKGCSTTDTRKKLKRSRDAQARALMSEVAARDFRDEMLQYFARVRRDAGAYISAAASVETEVSV